MSFIKVNKKYHPQIFLDERKYEVKNKKIENLINDDLELTSSDSDSLQMKLTLNDHS